MEPAIDSGTFLIVADGTSQWIYREHEGTYRQDPLMPVPDGYRVRPVSFSLFLGALPVLGDVDSVDELLAAMDAWRTDDDKGWSRRLPDETYLGRPVAVIERGPLRCGSGGSESVDGSRVYEEECYGFSRLWIDTERLLVLRHVGDDDGRGSQSFEASVTRLDYDTEFEDSRFEFEPPPGAVQSEEDGSGSSSGTMGPGIDPPAGFLRMGMVPRGYSSVSQGQEGGESGIVSVDEEFRSPGDVKFTVSQRKRSLPDALKVGDKHELRGLTMYATTTDAGWKRVAWEEEGVTVVLEAQAIPIEEVASGGGVDVGRGVGAR
ncbi:MAG: hypothetical protein WD557_07145 [Dehalococcoidia bacterium]